MKSPINRAQKNRFTCVDESAFEALLNELASENFQRFMLEGSVMRDKKSFIEGASSVLPLNPPLSAGFDNWDAFADSVWGGLSGLTGGLVAIVWKAVDRIVQSDLEAFYLALNVLVTVSQELSRNDTNAVSRKEVLIFLIR